MESRSTYHKKKRRKKTVKKSIIISFLLISIGLVIFSLINIIDWNKDNQDTEKIAEDVNKSVKEKPAKEATNVNPPEDKKDDYWDYIKMDMMSVDFSELKKKNPDTVGWIKVNGTNINYPVVQTKDNDYYLNHAYDKSKNSAGWIYADYRNNMKTFNKNTIIFYIERFAAECQVVKNRWHVYGEFTLILHTPRFTFYIAPLQYRM